MQYAANSNLVQNNNNSSQLSICTMPDPDDIYSTTLSTTDVSHSSVHIPQVHDRRKHHNTWSVWKKKLEDGSIIMLNTYLKLYVPQNILQKYPSSSFQLGNVKGFA